jgi:hypothetical protein
LKIFYFKEKNLQIFSKNLRIDMTSTAKSSLHFWEARRLDREYLIQMHGDEPKLVAERAIDVAKCGFKSSDKKAFKDLTKLKTLYIGMCACQ